jgi:hypothetical protein
MARAVRRTRPPNLAPVDRMKRIADGGMTVDYEADFFITYNGNDEDWATWIADTLEAAGYTVVFQKWDSRPGENFMAAMDHALAICRHTLGVLSPDYLASVFTRAEWTAAYRQALLGKPRGFIPVRVAKCDVAPLLGPLAYIDLVDVEEAEAKDRLLEGVAERGCRGSGTVRYPGGASS